MAKYKLLTPEEAGAELATMLASFNAELLKKGIDRALVERLTERVAGAAISNVDGHCGPLARLERVVLPSE